MAFACSRMLLELIGNMSNGNALQKDFSTEDIEKAIANSMNDLDLSQTRSNHDHQRIGLAAVADRIHPASMSFEDQMELAKRQSEAEGQRQNSVENEWVRLALQQSLKEQAKVDTDTREAIKQSLLDTNYAANHDKSMTAQRSRAMPLRDTSSNVMSVDELTTANRCRPALWSQKLAGSCGGRSAEEAAVQAAIKASLADMAGQSSSSCCAAGPSYRPSAFSPYKRQPAANRAGKPPYRPVVIDGCNVGYLYGKDDRFDAQGLVKAYEYFKERGYDDDLIVIIVKHMPQLAQADMSMLCSLEKLGVLHWSSSRRYDGPEGALIRSDDDLFILDVALQRDGVVVSRDRFRDNYDKMTTYRKVIRDRLVKPHFIGGRMMLQQDPLGPGGPILDDFLRF